MSMQNNRIKIQAWDLLLGSLFRIQHLFWLPLLYIWHMLMEVNPVEDALRILELDPENQEGKQLQQKAVALHFQKSPRRHLKTKAMKAHLRLPNPLEYWWKQILWLS